MKYTLSFVCLRSATYNPSINLDRAAPAAYDLVDGFFIYLRKNLESRSAVFSNNSISNSPSRMPSNQSPLLLCACYLTSYSVHDFNHPSRLRSFAALLIHKSAFDFCDRFGFRCVI